MLGLKMSSIIRHKRYGKSWFYLSVILCIVICIIIYAKVQTFIEKQNHENWVKQKEQEFKPVIDFAYRVMKGEEIVSQNNPLYLYDISDYVKQQDTWETTVKIEVSDIEEDIGNKRYTIKIIYSQEIYGKKGELLMGASRVHSDWTVEKGNDGMWEIVDIYELA